ncbi:DNA double-strand break repair protein Mre11 [Haloparvum sedimenti]|uniref:DNA double-strand break repair protein Mre11 n=1 Tax=Haloparvum sedimenti TaxID=1678448 RepID=UPI00071E780B|nr:DNA double-strand break repair protein Mre11 [Haloparvum sedimenti]
MTRVIHTGDTHIGYQQYHSPVRRQDFLDAFEQVVADAVADDVDAVVHAGDLFHDRRPELQDLLGTLSVLRDLDDAGIPFLAIVGNHESTRGGQWLDLFESLGLATRLDDAPTVVGDTAFYGLDHVPVSRRDDLEYEFEPHDADAAALVAHGLFEPFAHADWDTEELLTTSTVDFDALLLGDNHKADTAQVRNAWVTYPGSTERASASEEAGRGYNLVRFGGDAEDGGDAVDIRRRALETRPFAFVSVDLREGEGIERVREQVRQHDLADAVAIVEVTGDGEPVTPAAVEEFATDEGALIARVTDRREVETETEVDVSFADPEDAVRERIGEMGLSTAALDVDETVRASKVADSNVREEVKTRLEDRLEDGDLGAFETGSGVVEERTGDGNEVESDAGEPGGGVADAEGTEKETDAEGTEKETDAEGTEKETDAEGTDEGASDASADDGQVSMEDYL